MGGVSLTNRASVLVKNVTLCSTFADMIMPGHLCICLSICIRTAPLIMSIVKWCIIVFVNELLKCFVLHVIKFVCSRINVKNLQLCSVLFCVSVCVCV